MRRSEARAACRAFSNDVGILNYALVLEYLQASFYTEAERSGALSGKTAQAATVVGATERAHVKAFREAARLERGQAARCSTFKA